MFDPEEMKAAADALEKIIVQNGYKLSTGFVGTPLLCTVLSEIGKSNTAYSLLLQTDDPSWLYSVHQGATTIWERWNSYTIANGFGDVSMNSFNHYSFGAVMEWMYRFMVGIQSSGFGFEGVKFTPQPDTRNEADIPHGQEKITWVKGSYKIPSGIIKSEWEMKDGVFKYFCSSPVKAEIIIPNIPEKSSVIIDGKRIAISDLRTDMGNHIIDIECGEHTLEI
jgi:alpha-L-rhamnosidase